MKKGQINKVKKLEIEIKEEENKMHSKYVQEKSQIINNNYRRNSHLVHKHMDKINNFNRARKPIKNENDKLIYNIKDKIKVWNKSTTRLFKSKN